MSSKSTYPSEGTDSRILRGYCGPERSATQPKLYLGPEPVPKGYPAEDEWSVADVAKGMAEDLPCPRHSGAVIERPTLRCRQPPNSPPPGDVNEMGPIGKQGVKVGLKKTRPFFSKCTCQYPEMVEKKRRLDSVNLDPCN